MNTRRRVAVLATVLVAVTGTPATAVTPRIGTVAGSLGTGRATAVKLETDDITVAGHTLYVADRFWNVVRRIDLRTGTATILAGTGNPNTSGDGGPATRASLSMPTSLAVGPDGAVYVGTAGSIRRVGTDGIVTTYAGGGKETRDGVPARSARINWSSGMAFAPDGDLVYGDTDHRVRRIDQVTNLVTTVAGIGTAGYSGDGGPALLAQLRYPNGLAVAPDGTIFVADAGNNRVRAVDPLGFIRTVAGNGTRGRAGGPWHNGDGGPATQAMVSGPTALLRLPDGSLLVGATAATRRVGPDGRISTWLAHTGSGLGRGADGATYVASGFQVRRRTARGAVSVVAGTMALLPGIDGPATRAQLFRPTSVASGPHGVFVGEEHSGMVLLVDHRGVLRSWLEHPDAWGNVEDDFDPWAKFDEPTALAVDEAGRLYVADAASGEILVSDGRHRLRRVAGQWNPICLYEADTDGAGDGGSALAAELCSPAGVAAWRGRVWIADTGHHRVRLVERGKIRTVAGSLASGRFPDEGSGFSGDGGPGTKARLHEPRGLAVDSRGRVYVADAGNGRVRRIDTNGRITTVAGSDSPTNDGLALHTRLSRPVAVAVDRHGRLYILEDRGRLLRVDANGRVVHLAGTGMPGFSGDGGDARRAQFGLASGLAVNPDGTVAWVADFHSHRIRRIDLR